MYKKLIALLLISVSWMSLMSFTSASTAHAEGPKLWIENDGGLGQDYVTNGKEKSKHTFFGAFDLTELVKDNPTSLALTEKQSQYNTYAHLSYWLGVLPSAGFLGYGLGNQDTTMSVASLVSLIGTTFLTVYFTSESRHFMHEAMNHYNGVQKPSSSSPGNLSSNTRTSPYQPSLASADHSIGLSFSF